ncbi:MAG TPA: polysaccharide biosynthesis tyrosine autokinase [Thermoanaerobaculia bacterium]|jgi:capsular exopolysaccharide synthesis family protein
MMDLNTAQEVHLSHYWNIIYKRWKIALAILIVVMVGTFLASYFSTPLYKSSVSIQIERENQNQLTVEDLFGIEASDQEFMQTQYYLLKSRGLAERTIKDHSLLSDPEFYPAGIAGKSPAEIEQIRGGMAAGMLGNIMVEPVKGTNLVDVSYVGTSPKLAQKVAEGLADSYMRMNVEKKLDATRQASDFLTRQIAAVRGDIDDAQQQLTKYGESKGIISTGDASNVTVQKLTMLNTDLTAAGNDRMQKEAAYQTLLNADPEAVASPDSLVARLTEEQSRLEREYAQKLAVYRADAPDMIALHAQADKVKQSRKSAINDVYEKAKASARSAMAASIAREQSMHNAFDEQKRETLKLNANAFTYADLRSVIESKRTLLDQLTKRLDETEVTSRLRGSNTSNVHVVEHAQAPGGRFNLTMKKNLQSAFPLGVILGLAAIFFLEYMDRSIKTPEELERVTHYASLGVIPAAASVSNSSYAYRYRGPGRLRVVEEEKEDAPAPNVELIPFRDSRSPIAEAYRAFRTSLLLASANSPKVMVITSTFAREGKTTTSVNLATVLAQMGKPVLLIDADLRRPRIQKVFRDKLNLGLVNYLAANINIDDVIQPTEVPNLSVILSGPTPPNPSELLASDRMKHLIEEMRGRFAYVIFDSPPVMAVTDAIVLSSKADGVVLTVHGGNTPRDLVQRAAEKLRQSNIPVLGALLNNLDLQQYGYTYRKNYYDYYEPEAPRPAARKAAVKP